MRYLLFRIEEYYPNGGMEDICAVCPDIDGLIQEINRVLSDEKRAFIDLLYGADDPSLFFSFQIFDIVNSELYIIRESKLIEIMSFNNEDIDVGIKSVG